ncbi:MAG: MarR family winged helix-turn-helix transcriptional regulator [Halofilum sp. (in: g-proteobacteria)]|nr:MarR family winged helix-turn-helix transcriptional regulator [Halofilum sp. (in: g-proteobacteria)]
MVESVSLRIAFGLAEAHEALMHYLADRLAEAGHAGVTASALGFLGQLDCGVNHAAGIARRLGVSRQMVAKTVAEMERAGWLRVAPDTQHGNRKTIRFTADGERLMADARQVLATLDAEIERACGTGFAERMDADLGRLRAVLTDDR